MAEINYIKKMTKLIKYCVRLVFIGLIFTTLFMFVSAVYHPPAPPSNTSHQSSIYTLSIHSNLLTTYFSPSTQSNSIQYCYSHNWLIYNSIRDDNSRITRGELYYSVFTASGLPMYDSVLYGLPKLSLYKNAVRIGKELRLIDENKDYKEYVDYTEAVKLIEYVRLHFDELKAQIKPPESPIDILNSEDIIVNDYLLELRKIPDSLLEQFNQDGWKMAIDFKKVNELSKQYKVNCIGATIASEKTIYIANPNAVLHEFGHYVVVKNNWATDYQYLYIEESGKSPLSNHAKSNVNEYFAECFAVWLSGKTRIIDNLKTICPETYDFFVRQSSQW